MKDILWKDRERILGMPISFTKYSITDEKFIMEKGFLNITEEEVLLYRIKDLALKKNLFDRMLGVGSIEILSTDTKTPKLIIKVKKPSEVKELIGNLVEAAKGKHGFKITETDFEDSAAEGQSGI